MQNVFMRIGAEWSGFAAMPDRLVAEGDTVVALGEHSGTCKATGKHFKAPMVHVWTFGAGGVVAFRQHTDTVLVQRVLQ